MKPILLLWCLLMLGCQANEWDDLEDSAAFGCKPETATDLPWLRGMIENSQNGRSACQVFRVDQGTYNGETVFIPYLTGVLCCTCGSAVYNCQGDVVFVCDRDEEDKIKRKKAIWQQ